MDSPWHAMLKVLLKLWEVVYDTGWSSRFGDLWLCFNQVLPYTHWQVIYFICFKLLIYIIVLTYSSVMKIIKIIYIKYLERCLTGSGFLLFVSSLYLLLLLLWLLLFVKILSYMQANKLASQTFLNTSRKIRDFWVRDKRQFFTQSNSNTAHHVGIHFLSLSSCRTTISDGLHPRIGYIIKGEFQARELEFFVMSNKLVWLLSQTETLFVS